MHYFQTEDRASLKTSEKREFMGPYTRVGNVRRGKPLRWWETVSGPPLYRQQNSSPHIRGFSRDP